MQINFTSFNYKPGTDSSAEEKHYLDYHVGLAKKLPGLRIYLTGKFRQEANGEPRHVRAAILGFDNLAAATAAIESDIAKMVREDGAAHLKEHTALAAQLPDLRYYVTGRLFESRGYKPDRFRCAILACDSFAAFDAAFHSRIHEELLKDEEATIANIRFHQLDAVAQV
jgi:uncharacterized protein (TIGR02118 family)